MNPEFKKRPVDNPSYLVVYFWDNLILHERSLALELILSGSDILLRQKLLVPSWERPDGLLRADKYQMVF